MSKTCIYEKKIWLKIKQFHFIMVRNFTMCYVNLINQFHNVPRIESSISLFYIWFTSLYVCYMSGYVGNVLWMNRDFGREFGLPYDQLDIQFFSFSLFYPF